MFKMWNRTEILEKASVGTMGWIPYHLNCCVPRPCQLLVFRRTQLPKWRTIQGSRVDTEKVENKSWFIVAKLLLHLVDFVEENCSLFLSQGKLGRGGAYWINVFPDAWLLKRISTWFYF